MGTWARAGAVAECVAAQPDCVVLVAAGDATRDHRPTSPSGAGGYTAGRAGGPDLGGADSSERLPLGLAVGQSLLDAVGWRGGRHLQAVAPDLAPAAAADLGRRLLAGRGRISLLALGDGSARRSAKAPGYLDPRAEAFDAAARAAMAADPQALLDLDPRLADDLLIAGRAAWQVLAGARLAGAAALGPGRVTYAEAPLGVGYLVASWSGRTA